MVLPAVLNRKNDFLWLLPVVRAMQTTLLLLLLIIGVILLSYVYGNLSWKLNSLGNNIGVAPRTLTDPPPQPKLLVPLTFGDNLVSLPRLSF